MVFCIILAVAIVTAIHGQRLLDTVAVGLDSIEKQTSEYRTYAKCLRQRDRAVWLNAVGSLTTYLDRLRSNGWLVGHASRINSLRSRADSLREFLDEFLTEYAKREVERHKSFFAKATLDNEQTAATIMSDNHNLVVAAAGSGKTRVLTARIALLVDSGVEPDSILALAYTKDAAHEMEERLQRQFGIESAKVKTIHSFGRELARDSLDFRSGVANQTTQNEIIRSAAERLSSRDRKFAVDLLTFAVDFRKAEEKKQEEFPDVRRYYEYLRRQEYETLNLKRVKSIAERDIGNFLFLNGVQFEYEAQTNWADASPDFRDYQPDFFLPDYYLWIEHWGINRNGKVPEWFAPGPTTTSSEHYRAGMEWKREQFRKHGRKLVETFQYQKTEGTLIPELKKQLEMNGVSLKEIPMEAILKRIDQLIHQDPLHELMFSFISKGKNNGLGISDVNARMLDGKASWTSKQKSFAGLMIPIWREYESELKERDMLDFSDMITLSLGVARKNGKSLAERYSHILIDEFQDITDPQLELIKCLAPDSSEGNTLFCVGDHRQNIFSYAGSDVRNILDFEKHFPYPERMTLSANYRCPKNIVDTSNAIINAGVYHDKPAVAASSLIQPIQLIQETGRSRYDRWEKEKAKQLLMELLSTRKDNEDILVLARYNFRLGPIMVEFPDHDKQRLNFKSIHKAKGTEADYVLILGCVGGLHGFPSKILEENLLDIVNNRKQNFNEKMEEERRLFYVALTRCRKQLYIFTSKYNRSRFISEISSYLGSAGQTVGVCIRCGGRIKFNTSLPLCGNCYSIWLKYNNRRYREKLCHSCGKQAQTTLARPLCIDCYKKLNQS